MPIEMESAKEEILAFLEKKTGAKSKFYFNDFTKLFPDAKGREVKKVLTALVKEEKLNTGPPEVLPCTASQALVSRVELSTKISLRYA